MAMQAGLPASGRHFEAAAPAVISAAEMAWLSAPANMAVLADPAIRRIFVQVWPFMVFT